VHITVTPGLVLAEDADIPAVAPPVIPHTWTGDTRSEKEEAAYSQPAD